MGNAVTHLHIPFGKRGNHGLDAKALRQAKGTITLPRLTHVYDARRGKYLGETKSIEVRFAPDWMGNVFACLPYKVAGVTISGLKKTYAPGDTVAFGAAVTPEPVREEAHTLRVQVFGPDGKERSLYADRIETKDGVAKGEVYLALNDPPGTWRLAVTDMVSGVEGQVAFDVTK